MKHSRCIKITAAIAMTAVSLFSQTYKIVDTGQAALYNDSRTVSSIESGAAFSGQDAQYTGFQPSYTDNGDGTITDNVTGLMWAQSPDMDGDGDIDALDKKTYSQAAAGAAEYSLAGYTDWRLPTIKELYSLILFSGIDPSGFEGSSTESLTPFINTEYFKFEYGDTAAGERIIDSQYTSSNLYIDGELLFGVNFADGRIKGYGLTNPIGPGDKTFSVLYVRGNTEYGINDFSDNGNGTITDNASGLMWMQEDSKTGMTWEEALSYAENMEYGGHSDWRLPNVKELQSIVDYSRSPGTTGSAAIDSLFNCTQISNEAGNTDYPCYWSSTTHRNWVIDHEGAWAAYVAFGRAMGNMQLIGQPAVTENWIDVHGAGAQRSDPKSGDPAEFPAGHGPQGDAVRIYNHVRLVRDADERPSGNSEYLINETGQTECYDSDGNGIDAPAPGEAFYGQDAQYKGASFSFSVDNGVVYDDNTGLMWQQIPASGTFTWQEAVDYCETLDLGGYDDWRMPSLKELFSISNFSSGWPYLDCDYFSLASGRITKDEQYWSSNYYVGRTVEGQDKAAFGVNHVTGHIKAYPAESHGPIGGKYVRAVRGNVYGENNFTVNSDGTITDNATGLMWAQADNGEGLDWEHALSYAENSELAGYSDWRLPNVKELQSIVDYSYSPSAEDDGKKGPAINPVFSCTPIINEGGNSDYGYYWTSTSAHFTSGEPYYYAWYVAFGMAVNADGEDFHGAGGVRFDTKVEGGPLGEGGERYYNFVRIVRNADNVTGIVPDSSDPSSLPVNFQLEQNYPNPFNPSTTIRFSLPDAGKTTLSVYNITGQLITTLADELLSQGYHEFQWQASNQPSGIYYYRLTNGSYSETRRMVLLK